MALSYVSVPGGGSTAQHAVPFAYIDKDHVKAFIDGAEAPFIWVDDSTIELDEPQAGDLTIQRETPFEEALAIFAAPSFRAVDLNLASKGQQG